MRYSLPKQARRFIRIYNCNRRWKKVNRILSCIILFCTMYVLILPAVTMEKQTICGLEQHIHDETCYAENSDEKVLICEIPEHEHMDSCYAAEADSGYAADEKYFCGQGEHQHTEDCFSEDGILLCTMPEHTHTEVCLSVSQNTRVEEPEITLPKDYDISNGTAVFICGELKSRTAILKKRLSDFRTMAAAENEEEKNFIEHLKERKGSLLLTLKDRQDENFSRDENGNYTVTLGKGYELVINVQIRNGILPGKYVYELPEGIVAGVGSGNLEWGSNVVGSWSVNEQGRMILDFSQEASGYDGISLDAHIQLTFTSTGTLKLDDTRGGTQITVNNSQGGSDIGSDGDNLQVTIHKVSGMNGAELSDAEFGIFEVYEGESERVASGVTDDHGNLIFKTKTDQDKEVEILLFTKTAYYIQELKAPPGYKLDERKHWFYFSDERDSWLENSYEGIQWVNTKTDTVYTVNVVNELEPYTLPETGGNGIYLFVTGGFVLTAGSLMYGYGLRYKRKKRR